MKQREREQRCEERTLKKRQKRLKKKVRCTRVGE
jgi:hypothetical protein